MLGAVVYLAVHVQVVADAELRVARGLHGPSRASAYAHDLVGLFNPAPFAVLSGSLVVGALVARRPRAAAAAAATMLGAGVTTQFLKPLLAFQRDFPPGHFMGPVAYPSGHTTAVMSLSLALIIVSPARLRPLAAAAGGPADGRDRLLASWCSAAHYPSDIVGGLLVATAWACVATAVLRLELSPEPQRRGAGRDDPGRGRPVGGRAAARGRARLRLGQHDVRLRRAGDRRRRARAQR